MWTKAGNNGRKTKWLAITKKLGRSEHAGCNLKQRWVNIFFYYFIQQTLSFKKNALGVCTIYVCMQHMFNLI